MFPFTRQSQLGHDGHEKRGEFFPPIDYPRRMWAGGRIRFHQPLHIGVAVIHRSIIKKIENSYSPNFARNGEDGHIEINDIFEDVELKTSKVKALKKGGYSKTSFAFHADGLLYHQKYIFNTWDKNSLLPISVFYITSADSIKIINEELAKLSTAWSIKPKTKGGYDVIRIKEELLLSMIKETKIIDNCKVYIL